MDNNNSHMTYGYTDMEGTIRIPMYGLIFLSGLIGNILVIITLTRNKRLQVVTNVFLLNLAVSDLLLGVFCMPLTLIGALLREFIFGEAMCKIITYLQSVTVSVNAWTLVAISLERFYAVCEPLKSRRWQTSNHAFKVILAIWSASLSLMIPIAWSSTLLPTNPSGKYKCREKWPNVTLEQIFNVLLDTSLLGIPLLIMILAYTKIGLLLRREIPGKPSGEKRENMDTSVTTSAFLSQMSSADECIYCNTQTYTMRWAKVKAHIHEPVQASKIMISGNNQPCAQHGNVPELSPSISLNMNSCNHERRIAIKKRVTCMLFVVVLEFFICWTPIYVVNTISSFNKAVIYENLGYFTVSCFHLLSYLSSCCNPITYCFMNKNFRREFLQTFAKLCYKIENPMNCEARK